MHISKQIQTCTFATCEMDYAQDSLQLIVSTYHKSENKSKIYSKHNQNKNIPFSVVRSLFSYYGTFTTPANSSVAGSKICYYCIKGKLP